MSKTDRLAYLTLCVSVVFIQVFLTANCRKLSDDDDDKAELPEEDKWLVTKTVYFDFTVDLEPAGRVAIALFGEAAPNTVNNFAALSKGNYRGDVSLPHFLRIKIPNFKEFVVKIFLVHIKTFNIELS